MEKRLGLHGIVYQRYNAAHCLQLVRRGVLKIDPLTIIPARSFLKKNSSVQPSKEEEAC